MDLISWGGVLLCTVYTVYTVYLVRMAVEREVERGRESRVARGREAKVI